MIDIYVQLNSYNFLNEIQFYQLIVNKYIYIYLINLIFSPVMTKKNHISCLLRTNHILL